MHNLKHKGPRDANRISLSADWEIAWWTESPGVSEQQLRALVQQVGHSAGKVKETGSKQKEVGKS